MNLLSILKSLPPASINPRHDILKIIFSISFCDEDLIETIEILLEAFPIVTSAVCQDIIIMGLLW